MKKSDYLPSIARLVELADKADLSMDDLRHLHRVKNWLRSKESAITAGMMNGTGPHKRHDGNDRARGIAI